MVAATNTGVPFAGGRVNSPGQEQQADNSYFGPLSTSLVSHPANVSEVPLLIRAFNLVGTDLLEVLIETKTTTGSVLVPLYINGKAVTLSATNNVLLLDLPGYYRFRIPSTSLGTAIVVGQETGMSYFSLGLANYSQDRADLTFVETATVHPVVSGNSVAENVKLSALAGNLIQIQPDGIYYGNQSLFVDQYVSSSTGSDTNPGTQSQPLLTIQKAISNIPEGTMANIHLKAGDTFHTYPTATGDTINTLTFAQSVTTLSAGLYIGNRDVSFVPYGDAAVDAVVAYNVAHNTFQSPYQTQEENFPTINFTVSIPTDTTTLVPAAFIVGINGAIRFFGINLTVGTTGAATTAFQYGAVTGSGIVFMQGGHLRLGSVPFLGDQSAGISQAVSFTHVNVSNHSTAPANNYFLVANQQFFINTIAAVAPGAAILPSYTDIGDNVEAFLATAALWPGVTIYSTAFRAFRHVITAIPIA